jgi:hypothetical protein
MKRAILLLAGLGFAVPACATPNVPVKCSANEDRVWVYDNLTTWTVSVHLKCGTLVDVLGTGNGYVRIRTADGEEGYVPNDAIPSSELSHVIVVLNPARSQATAAEPSVPPPNIPRAAEPPVPPASNVAPPAAPAPAAPSAAQESSPAPAKVPDTAQTPVPVPSAPPSNPTASANHAEASAGSTSVISPSPATHKHADPVADNVRRPIAETGREDHLNAEARAHFMTITRKARPISAPMYSDDDEELPDADAISTEDIAECSAFFSAYGVTPMQYKWIADERGKEFPGVCPAPEPSMVDYVVIFTHDLDSFVTTAPEPVHTDTNGFSDWTPVTAVDDTKIPASELDKAHREYAWVFRVHRGTFDPAKFNPRWHPLFTKSVSTSSKSIEDAMQFMAENSSAR